MVFNVLKQPRERMTRCGIQLFWWMVSHWCNHLASFHLLKNSPDRQSLRILVKLIWLPRNKCDTTFVLHLMTRS